MKPTFDTRLDLRSYGAEWQPDRHSFAQLVLPVTGTLRLEIAGRTGRLDPLHGAIVAAGAWHAQASAVQNRSLILDLDGAALEQGAWADLLDRPFTTLGPAARKLADYMALMAGERAAVPPALLRGWVPLLLDTLALGAPQAPSRLAALLAQVAQRPGLPWTTASMADAARMSVSRLHALFRAELDTSPHAWLLGQRLQFACLCLATSNSPIAEVAQAAGFSDQSALTRAMKTAMDTTPGAYRRETASKRQ